MRIHLEESKQQLRLIYKNELKETSRVPDHCATFALSDKHDPSFRKSCNEGDKAHEHDQLCLRCELVKNSLNEVKNTVNDMLQQVRQKQATCGNSNDWQQEIRYLEEKLYDIDKAIEKFML